MEKSRRKNGYSLIELLVTIAIIAIVFTGTATAFYSISGWQLKQNTASIDTGLKKARLLSMTSVEGSVKFIITYDGKKYSMSDGKDTYEISSGSTKLSYTDSENKTCEINESQPLTLTFIRSTGAFRPMSYDGETSVYCMKITASQGEKQRSVVLVPLTGKTYISN